MLVLLGVPVGDPEWCTERDVGASEGSIFPSSLPPSRTDFRSSRRLVRPTVMGFRERMTRPKMGYSTKEMVSGAFVLSTHPSMSASHLAQHVIYDLAMLVLRAERDVRTRAERKVLAADCVEPCEIRAAHSG